MSFSTATWRAANLIPAGVWRIDPSHSTIEFQVKYMMVATVKGRFTAFRGTLESDGGDDLEAVGTIQTASIDTDDAKRDEHLRSADLFDVVQHPEITFISTEITSTGDATLRILGELTIKGRTQPIELTGELVGVGVDPCGHEHLGLVAHGAINRQAFGLTWNQAVEAGGALVADRVGIELDVSAVRVRTDDS